MRPTLLTLALATALLACKSNEPAPTAAASASGSAATTAATTAATATPPLSRAEFNRRAVELNLPLFWAADANHNGTPDPDEVRALLFYGPRGAPAPRWVDGAAFTAEFAGARDAILKLGAAPAAPQLPPDEADRRRLVGEDLDQGAATLVASNFRDGPATDRALAQHLLAAARWIDGIYATMTGANALASRVPQDDPASQSLFRRNWGPRCLGAKTLKNPACSAIPGAPQPVNDAYPAALQSTPSFCDALEKRPDAKVAMEHFSVTRDAGGKLVAQPYTQAYAEPMRAVATELHAAAAAETDPNEAALRAYLEAAAQSFTTNDWGPADEAWSRMNAQNSRFYVRVGPDEVLTDPCNHKAQFHLTFARINGDSLKWQQKLAPVEEEMERALASLLGAPYAARKVTFHLPDFIDIVFNAGDDRAPFGGTIGQSLPNWGKVAAEGRGRTVAMSNLNSDPDSLESRRKRAESLLDADAMKAVVDAAEPGLLATILHEATHNLGPTNEYAFKGRKPEAAFGGKLASMLEELKAQSGALYYIDWLKKKGLVSEELARNTYADSILWALRHISDGMHTGGGDEPYAQLSAIQVGFLLDEGALVFDAAAPAANGADKGAFHVRYEALPAAIDKLMKLVGTIKATNDRAGAEALVAKYVDGPVVPQPLVTERALRFPRQTFVYAADL